MQRKLALKKLTHSDLTFFKRYFEAQQYEEGPSKQKAINLNTNVLVDELYPGLQRGKKYFTELEIQGPGWTTKPHILTRKILFSAKNWRLNGELVHDPEEGTNRYESLKAGDLALFEFFDNADGEPVRIRIILLSQILPDDKDVYDTLESLVLAQSMVRISEEVLVVLLDNSLSQSHLLNSFLTDSRDLELLAEGADILTEWETLNTQATLTEQGSGTRFSPSDFNISAKPSLRRVTAEAFQKAEESKAYNGRIGEELVAAYFTSRPHLGYFEWSSKINFISPYDFKRTDLQGRLHESVS